MPGGLLLVLACVFPVEVPAETRAPDSATALTTLTTNAQRNLTASSGMFAFFQRAIGPTPIRNIAGAISGTNTRLK